VGAIIYLGSLTAVGALVYLVMTLFFRPARRARTASGAFWGALLGVSLALFIFGVGCAPNYYRLTFTELAGYDARPSSAQDLSALCAELTVQANALRAEMSAEGLDMNYRGSAFFDAAKASKAAVSALSLQYPFWTSVIAAPKPMPLSETLSYLNLTGFYSPYTGEANVNAHMPGLEMPFTMCHELAHTLGFMREDEANFIAFLSCRESDRLDFQYSGTVCALNYSMNELSSADRDSYYRIRDTYSDELINDLNKTFSYWSKYDTPAATVSTTVNNIYLKANNQSDGVKSYGRMVDLLLADYRTRHMDV
jgi:hypothetical protein